MDRIRARKPTDHTFHNFSVRIFGAKLKGTIQRRRQSIRIAIVGDPQDLIDRETIANFHAHPELLGDVACRQYNLPYLLTPGWADK